MAQIMRAPVDFVGETQGYRPARNPNHYGVDLGWSTAHGGPNHPILATADCEVVKTGTMSDGAKYVVTRTDKVVAGKYVYCLFWHLSRIDVKKGQQLKMGDPIGVMGSTGTASGVHLHLEVWIAPIDYTTWKLSDKTKYAVDPHTMIYVYADQEEGSDTAPKYQNTVKVLADGIADGEIVPYEAWFGIVEPDVGLNVRTGPGTEHEVITALQRGTRLQIVAEQSRWGQLASVGWVCLDYVKKVDDLKIGDRVRVSSDAVVYGTGMKWDAWVYNAEFFIRNINGDKATIAPLQTGAVTGNIHRKFLTKV
jgi:hypothetical protein